MYANTPELIMPLEVERRGIMSGEEYPENNIGQGGEGGVCLPRSQKSAVYALY